MVAQDLAAKLPEVDEARLPFPKTAKILFFGEWDCSATRLYQRFVFSRAGIRAGRCAQSVFWESVLYRQRSRHFAFERLLLRNIVRNLDAELFVLSDRDEVDFFLA